MNLRRGWGVNERDLRAWRLLEHIADHSQCSDVATLPEWAQDTDSREYADAMADVAEFDSSGRFAINSGMTLPSLRFNAHGQRELSAQRERRDNRRTRTRELRDALLAWLDDEKAKNNPSPVIDRFIQTAFGLWYGEPFPKHEIQDATQWLYEAGFIRGITTEESGIIRPSLTARGQDIVDREASVNDAPVTAPTVTHQTWNVGDNAQIQQGNQYATINNTYDSTEAELISELVAALRALARDRDDAPDVELAAAEVQRAAGGSDRGSLRRSIASAQAAALGAFATDSGHQVFQAATQLLHHLG